MSMEQDPASRAQWPLPTEKIDPHPSPLTEAQQRILAAVPLLDATLPPGAVIGAGRRINDVAMPQRITMPGPEPLQEVITWVPDAEAEKVPGMERVAIVEWAGRKAKRCVMWDEDGWLDAWSLQHVRNRVLFVAEVKGPQ